MYCVCLTRSLRRILDNKGNSSFFFFCFNFGCCCCFSAACRMIFPYLSSIALIELIPGRTISFGIRARILFSLCQSKICQPTPNSWTVKCKHLWEKVDPNPCLNQNLKKSYTIRNSKNRNFFSLSFYFTRKTSNTIISSNWTE